MDSGLCPKYFTFSVQRNLQDNHRHPNFSANHSHTILSDPLQLYMIVHLASNAEVLTAVLHLTLTLMLILTLTLILTLILILTRTLYLTLILILFKRASPRPINFCEEANHRSKDTNFIERRSESLTIGLFILSERSMRKISLVLTLKQCR